MTASSARKPSWHLTLLRFFTWWNGATLNTLYYTRRHGVEVGRDEFGNTYYRSRAKDPALGFERRWVIYAGQSDGSLTPPGWYGWLHHQTDVPPTQESFTARPWMRPYEPNMTGTPLAYRPPGSLVKGGRRPSTGSDYDAWTPG